MTMQQNDTHNPRTSSKTHTKLSQSSIELGFKKQQNLEHHLKWTKAFIVNGIPFNVIRNESFRSALKSNCKAGVTIPDYNMMITIYLDKLKGTLSEILDKTILEYLSSIACTIALDGWTNC